MSIIKPACECGEVLINHPGGAHCGTKHTDPRVCVKEDCIESDGLYIGENGARMYRLKEWKFLYNDGSVETVTSREWVE